MSTIDYAGHAALVVLLGVGEMTYRSAVANGAKDDWDKASRRLGRNRRLVATARAQAVEIVSRRRADIDKLANAALRHGHVDGRHAQLILEDSPLLDDYLKHRGT